MPYPFWDVPVGYGVLMATIAVFHVFVSHFAIGGGLYLVVNETAARKAGDQERLAFLERLSKFFALVTLVAGALTGVGIWFIIGLLAPSATEALIHNYVWGWAIEWTFFVLEIAAAIFYFYGWKKMTAKAHLTMGWIYFVSSWLSLVIITGILTFMLTPGQWLQSGYFWHGFFNPTYWPSVFLRTGICVMLAGLYAMLVASRLQAGDFKGRMVRNAATWGVLGLVITVLFQFWYMKTIPAAILAKAAQTMPTPMRSMELNVWFAIALAVLVILAAALLPRRLPTVGAIVIMAVGMGWFGSFEWFRESLRKPYIITGYMYGNSMEVALADTYKKDGLLAHIPYKTGNDGADLFRHACRNCHTLTGYKALKPAFDGMDRAFIVDIVKRTHVLKGNMPPFLGNEADAEKIADYLYAQTDHRSVAAIYGLQGPELGAKLYALRCGKCHVAGKETDNSAAFAGQSAKDLHDLLDSLPSLSPNMPACTLAPAEHDALAAHLEKLGKGVK